MRSAGLVAGALLISTVGAGAAGAASGGSGGSGGARHSALQAAGVHAGGDRQVGRWRVEPVGPGAYRLTWRSPTPIPVTDAPVQVRHAGALETATESADGRTVSVLVASATPPDPAAYAVVQGSRVLAQRGGAVGRLGGGRTTYAVPSRRALLDDPGTRGTHAVTSSDYTLAPVKLPDIPQLSEMVGHVVSPVDATDQSPLVLFLHGRHNPCYTPGGSTGGHRFVPGAKVWSCQEGDLPVPSYLGYDYVQRLLASQGYVTVSISADAINALDYHAPDGGAQARAALVRDHLRAWVDFVASGEHPADLSNVVLVGHSRGGEGANRASLDLPRNEGYAVTGQVLIGPTDFGFQAAPSTPTVTILPYCDGDVSDLQGQNFTDDGRDITADPTQDLALHSSVLVMGANHNFFNTEWTPGISQAPSFDDWFSGSGPCATASPTRLSAAQQRKVGKTYIAGAVHLFASGDDSALPLFDGSPVAAPSAGGADVRTHAIGGGLDTVRPGLDGTASAAATADVRLCTGVSDSRDDPTACQPKLSSVRAPHWPSAFFAGVPLRTFLDVGWQSAGEQGGLDLAQSWDLSGDTALDLRTIVDPRHGPVRLGVSLTDADGHSAVVTPPGGGNLAPLPRGGYSLAKRWAQDLRAPLAGVSGVDLTRITQVGLVSRNDAGRVFVADISATPASGVSTSPTAPTAVFSVGTVRQPEGDGTDPVTVDVPWQVTGDLGHQAEVTVVHSLPFSFDGSVKTETLVIPAHTTSGVLHVRYRPNDLDDAFNRFHGLTAYAVSGIETDQYLGGAKIIDDDPTPGLSVRARTAHVAAGRRAKWDLTLEQPTNYEVFALAKPVKAVDGPQLRVGDLPQKFRKRYVGSDVPLSLPLYKTRTRFFVQIRKHRLTGTLAIPTRRGLGVPRTLSLTFRAPHFDLAHPLQSVEVVPRHR